MVMRILVVSNLYPPYHIGGYELACQDVVTCLSAIGHHVSVTTSTRNCRRPQVGQEVARIFWMYMPARLTGRPIAIQLLLYLRDRIIGMLAGVWNRAVIKKIVQRRRPDLILIFNPSHLGLLLLNWLHGQAIPVVHDVSDLWLLDAYSLLRTVNGAPVSRQYKIERKVNALVARAIRHDHRRLDLRRSYFRSHFLRQQMSEAGLRVGAAPVIHHGIPPNESGAAGGGLRAGIVFSGRLWPEKGPDILLEALLLLKHNGFLHGQEITLIGPVEEGMYRKRLEDLRLRLQPEVTVRFTGQIPREEAITLVRRHAIFVFPVLWDEPFSIVLLEAMRDGLAIVATKTGGSSEILQENVNCLVIPKRDSSALATAIARLIKDPALRYSLGSGARAAASEFTIEQSMERIARHLEQVHAEWRQRT